MPILNTNNIAASAGVLAEAGALGHTSEAQTGITKKVSNKQASKAKPKETTAAIPEGNRLGAASLAAKQKKSGAPQVTKAELILKKLRTAKGASVETLMADTGWQAHSVRGFLSATVKKKMALALMSEVGKDGVRRYRIDNAAKA